VRAIYSVLLLFLLPFALLRLLWRSWRDARYRRRWSERFGRLPTRCAGELIWIHAVSVGEVLAAEPLIEALRGACPACGFHVTTTTPTASALVSQRLGASVSHSYLPFDLTFCVNRFMDRLQPTLALFVETEIWPNLLHACRARGIDVSLVNARLSECAQRRYAGWPRLTAATLGCLTGIGAQTDADAERFIRLGAARERVCVTGNLKFDRLPAAGARADARDWRRRWGESRRVWIAASVHDDECEQVIDAFSILRASHPDLFLCLAPRHPERTPAIAGSGLKTCDYSTAGDRLDDVDVLVVDVLGALDALYQAADVAFLGGSLVAHGGQNPIEALAAGVPVAHGPHLWNFLEIYRALDAAGAAREVTDGADLVRVIDAWLKDPAARLHAVEAGRVELEARRGAVGRTLGMLRVLGYAGVLRGTN